MEKQEKQKAIDRLEKEIELDAEKLKQSKSIFESLSIIFGNVNRVVEFKNTITTKTS